MIATQVSYFFFTPSSSAMALSSEDDHQSNSLGHVIDAGWLYLSPF